uniref:Integrase, catalytic region, zinc finger, CCHC-type, peptidase aspartic, catalytic n=1 Tax=Tanacetum cinerariifolium TaxID=118510 RepID=A0A699GIF5_TANCI|nr:hypothetical protein [Tanacetum cinerariifolium]
MTTLAKFMIIAGAKNRPPMLEKSLYDSWKSRMEHYMKNRENRRMILNSVQNGPLIWPTVTDEDGTTQTKKYDELSATEKIQADCDCKATNIVLQGLAVPVFNLGDDQIACLNKAMAFLIVIASLRIKMQVDSQELLNAIIVKEAGQILDEKQLAFLADSGILNGQAVQTIIPNNAAFQIEDLDAYDSDYDDVSNAQAILMANLSNCGSDIISEVPHYDSYHNDTDNQSVHVMQDFEQTLVVDFSNNKIHSDSNILPYSQYLQETQLGAVQETNPYAQQDSMILFVIEQVSEQMINHVNNWEKANQEKNNESLTAELDRYKERVKTFKQLLNIDLSSRERMIDSQMYDMIKENFALKEQIDSLKQNLSKQITEKEFQK